MEPKEVNGLFGGGNRTAGYVIYEPMVVVEISDETPCLKKEGEKCIEKGGTKMHRRSAYLSPQLRKTLHSQFQIRLR